MHLPDFDSSDKETLASKRQGPPTTKQDSNISDVPDREGEQSDSSDEETLASKRARLNQSIPNHADKVPQWARGEIEYTHSPMDNEKKNKEHSEAELSGKTPLEIFRLLFDDEHTKLSRYRSKQEFGEQIKKPWISIRTPPYY
ncbi:hypothetical protein JTB14_005642 [Gonioctena quinquepunctata]|nr:hypothetical protein JTB14_005642 [Gonioctena quinquepunctata]